MGKQIVEASRDHMCGTGVPLISDVALYDTNWYGEGLMKTVFDQVRSELT